MRSRCASRPVFRTQLVDGRVGRGEDRPHRLGDRELLGRQRRDDVAEGRPVEVEGGELGAEQVAPAARARLREQLAEQGRARRARARARVRRPRGCSRTSRRATTAIGSGGVRARPAATPSSRRPSRAPSHRTARGRGRRRRRAAPGPPAPAPAPAGAARRAAGSRPSPCAAARSRTSRRGSSPARSRPRARRADRSRRAARACAGSPSPAGSPSRPATTGSARLGSRAGAGPAARARLRSMLTEPGSCAHVGRPRGASPHSYRAAGRLTYRVALDK